ALVVHGEPSASDRMGVISAQLPPGGPSSVPRALRVEAMNVGVHACVMRPPRLVMPPDHAECVTMLFRVAGVGAGPTTVGAPFSVTRPETGTNPILLQPSARTSARPRAKRARMGKPPHHLLRSSE